MIKLARAAPVRAAIRLLSGERPVNSFPKTAANYRELTPLSYVERAAVVFDDSPAVVDGDATRTWAETFARCCGLGDALRREGCGRGDVVQVMLDNTAEMVEAQHGVPMSGATLGCVNTRLDAATVAYVLEHSEARVLVADARYAGTYGPALAALANPPRLVVVGGPGATYEAFVASGDAGSGFVRPRDEWDALAVNYTSGTTGRPKGVVLHHRGAYILALSNAVDFGGLGGDGACRYLWTLPMRRPAPRDGRLPLKETTPRPGRFHCNGWGFPWTLPAVGGANVCLRDVSADAIADAFVAARVTHLCGAPIVVRMAIEAAAATRGARGGDRAAPLRMMTGGAPPPAATLRRAEAAGLDVTHVYGLTETYGPATLCQPRAKWAALTDAAAAERRSRQGVAHAATGGVDVLDRDTGAPVPADGATLGEICFRGNIVMKGYLKDAAATADAFRLGAFASGDLAVRHADGYVQIKDRSKDIIISGGENISTVEIEAALMEHDDVEECAVVARPDATWGEAPCAFVEARAGATLDEAALLAFAKGRLAGFKAPKSVVFGALPKTSTGKIQKFALRDRARAL